MKKKQTVVNSLTAHEKTLLNRCISMANEEFELLKIRCTLISSEILGWEEDYGETSQKCVRVFIYGVDGVRIYNESERKENVILDFFIRYKSKVYQEGKIEGAVNIQKLIIKEYRMKKQMEKERIAKLRKRKSTLIKAA